MNGTSGEFRAIAADRGPLMVWLLALAAGIVSMLWLGQGHLATPALTEPAAWVAWLERRDPLIAAMAVLRLLGLAIAWYLVGVTAVSLVAHLARAARLVRLTDALSVPMVRRVTQQAVGLTLATAAVATVTHVARPLEVSAPLAAGVDLSLARGAETLVMVPLPDAADAGSTDVAAPPETLAVHRVADAYRLRMEGLTTRAEADDHARDDADAGGHRPGRSEAPDDGDRGRPGRSFEVEPGDHLWSIAERTLRDAWEREPTDQEVEPYWRRLIVENRDQLANPDDPDLLLPGQVLALPATPPAP